MDTKTPDVGVKGLRDGLPQLFHLLADPLERFQNIRRGRRGSSDDDLALAIRTLRGGDNERPIPVGNESAQLTCTDSIRLDALEGDAAERVRFVHEGAAERGSLPAVDAEMLTEPCLVGERRLNEIRELPPLVHQLGFTKGAFLLVLGALLELLVLESLDAPLGLALPVGFSRGRWGVRVRYLLGPIGTRVLAVSFVAVTHGVVHVEVSLFRDGAFLGYSGIHLDGFSLGQSSQQEKERVDRKKASPGVVHATSRADEESAHARERAPRADEQARAQQDAVGTERVASVQFRSAAWARGQPFRKIVVQTASRFHRGRLVPLGFELRPANTVYARVPDRCCSRQCCPQPAEAAFRRASVYSRIKAAFCSGVVERSLGA